MERSDSPVMWSPTAVRKIWLFENTNFQYPQEMNIHRLLQREP